jgi:membrane protein DedA with SNARE-associated domain
VFFGRFIALLRIFAGPLAGALRMRYAKFLVANATGGIVWAGGTTAVVYYLGIMAERWLQRFSWVGLIVALLCGMGATLFVKRRATRRTEAHGNASGPAAPASAGD